MNNGIFVNSPLNATQRDRLSHITNTMPRGIVLPSPYTVEMPFHFPPYRDWLRSNDDIVLICNTTIENNLTARVPAQSNTPFLIDWGDGTIVGYSSSFSFISYTYQYHGTYTIRVIGATSFGIYEGTPSNVNKFTALLSTGKATINATAFRQWGSLRQVPQSPVLGSDLGGLFYSSPFNLDIGSWNMSNVTTFYDMFAYGSFNNGGSYTIKNWNTSSATNMTTMFVGNSSFNQPLDNWNVRKVTNFSSMFNSATSFNGSLSGWALGADTAGTNCTSMFQSASAFNQNLSSWNTSNVTSMSRMFDGATSFNNAGNSGINNWNTSKVTNMTRMFFQTPFNQPIGNWDVSKVTDMNTMFYLNYVFNQDIGNWNVSGVTNIGSMFGNAVGFNNGNSSGINNWNTINVTTMSSAFLNASSFNQPLNNWNVRKVTSFASMFQGATSFNSSLSGWALGADTSGVNCSNMFNSATTFNQPIDNWDMSKVTSPRSMFYYATSFNQPLNNWNTSNINNMEYMFFSASSFNQDIGNWNVSNVTNFGPMFQGASAFNNGGSPSISGWNTSNATTMAYMFTSTAFNQPIGSWNVSKVQTMSNMFNGANAFNQDISNWNLAGLNASTSLDAFMTNKNATYSTTNYDALLIGWNNNKLATANGVANWRTDLKPNFSASKYTAGGAAATARADLVSYGWTITDGGAA